MKVLVCGGRNFNDPMLFGSWMGGVMNKHEVTQIIHGGAKGADFMAGKFAEWKGIPVRVFPADWKKHGKAAGPIRNKQMLEEGGPDLVLAFPGGRGTQNMVEQARASGVEVFEVDP